MSYRARDERDTKEVVVHHLVHAVREEAWASQRRVLDLLAKIDNDSLCEVRACELTTANAWLAVHRPSRSLRMVVEEGRVDRNLALAWAAQLASALGAIHRNGIAHGAVIPSAVFIDDEGVARLDPMIVDTGSLGALDRLDFEVAVDNEGPTAAADLKALAHLTHLMITGRVGKTTGLTDDGSATSTYIEVDGDRSTDDLSRLLAEMSDDEPAWRPAAEEVAFRLAALVRAEELKTDAGKVGAEAFADPPSESPSPARTALESAPKVSSASDTATESSGQIGGPRKKPTLGRYVELVEVGEGAMGRVFRATDSTTGEEVALKVLTGDWRSKPKVLRRFQKEARLLSEVENPYVARFIELAHVDDIWFMAVEFVEGTPLGAFLDVHTRVPPTRALQVAIDIARGLVDAHARGIIHRDIKPDNILLTEQKDDAGAPKVKLVDFGIARHIDETESLAMTRQGGVLGTPLYMAPEQCAGTHVDERADIYALGSTLFHMIAGRPPFSGGGPQAIMAAKMRDRAPNLRTIVPDAAEPIVHLVAHCLETDRDARVKSAADFIEAAEEALGTRARKIAAHPSRPESKSSKRYEFTWDLDASPVALWPYVSNTERVNRALGLGAMDAHFEVRNEGQDDEEVVQIAHLDHLGLSVTWREHPYEWIEGRRLGILREFSEGPFSWFLSTVDLVPLDGGRTRLVHAIEIEPRGMLGFAAALVEISVKARRNLERVYRRIERLVAGTATTDSAEHAKFIDPFEAAPPLSKDVEQRVERIEGRMVDAGAPPLPVERLGAFLRAASAADIARIRPLPFARRFNLEENEVVDACLVGAKEGLFELKWDLLCPKCRVPAALESTLKNLKDHAHCEACNLDFDLDLASGVEMVFASHPQVRQADTGLYCAASPAHSPHVVAQVRIAKDERFELPLELKEGTFRVSSRELPWAAVFNVHPRAKTSRWDVKLSEGVGADVSRSLKPGRPVLVFDNDVGREVVIRVERTAASHEAFTAARAAAHPLFRKLFPGEVLSSGRLVSVANVILLVVSAPNVHKMYETMSESDVYSELHRLFFSLDEHVGKEGGAMIKLVGNGIFASFADPAAAVRAALDVRTAVADHMLAEDLRIAAHQGPALAVTVNGRLDYFGRTVHDVDALLSEATANSIVLSGALCADPVVATLLRQRRSEADFITVANGPAAQRIALTAPTLPV